MTTAWGRAASKSSRHRQRAETERQRTELALLQQEMAIKDARWANPVGPVKASTEFRTKLRAHQVRALTDGYDVLLRPDLTDSLEGQMRICIRWIGS